jgi:hypothetical protein
MSKLSFFDFDASSDLSLSDAFAELSATGDWLAFHGTSSVNEDEIDKTGIRGSHLFTASEISNLVSIYRNINWCGQRTGGFGVLASFTWSRTIGLSVRPVYLSDYPERCLLFSTKNFAGGETARAIRLAIEYLVDYSEDEKLREKHYRFQRHECEDLVAQGANPSPIIEVNLNWLCSKVIDLQALYTKASDLRNRHQWGVVYAIRFSPDDLKGLADGRSEGIQAFEVIPPEKLVAKARVHQLTEELAMRRKNSAQMLRIESGKLLTGLQGFLAKNGCSNHKVAAPLNFSDRRTPDPEAGVDVSSQVIAQLRGNTDSRAGS